MYAIMRAITHIYHIKGKNFIIFSDSMSSVKVIDGFKLDRVQKITKDYTHLTNSGKTIVICWIPSHVNIRGIETADATAMSALCSSITKMKFPGHKLISLMSNFCLDEWQDTWYCCVNNKLHSIYNLLALLHTVKVSLVAIALSSIDFELVILG